MLNWQINSLRAIPTVKQIITKCIARLKVTNSLPIISQPEKGLHDQGSIPDTISCPIYSRIEFMPEQVWYSFIKFILANKKKMINAW